MNNSQKEAVSAYLKSKQLLLFIFVWISSAHAYKMTQLQTLVTEQNHRAYNNFDVVL